ncbi:hypothetical protein [Rhodopirellula bahusiensis]|uniref:hypothetical protein n=1 Tax=Rhodopirellula bahusiensis TaxID=2014065 RepID=UPI00117AF80D|nr:hypothetical protein [Rhodopirellula bahusiensis]
MKRLKSGFAVGGLLTLLVGPLGTALAMYESFHAISKNLPTPTAEDLSDSINHSLNTTVFMLPVSAAFLLGWAICGWLISQTLANQSGSHSQSPSDAETASLLVGESPPSSADIIDEGPAKNT